MLLASDEAALCLLLRTASLWLDMLPPGEIAGKTAEAVSTVRSAAADRHSDWHRPDVRGSRGRYRLSDDAAGQYELRNYSALFCASSKAIFTIINNFMQLRRPLQKSRRTRCRCGPEKRPDAVALGCASRNTSLKKDEHHDNVLRPGEQTPTATAPIPLIKPPPTNARCRWSPAKNC